MMTIPEERSLLIPMAKAITQCYKEDPISYVVIIIHPISPLWKEMHVAETRCQSKKYMNSFVFLQEKGESSR
jgi:hypothetical protein